MADFSALKEAIQDYIKQNGNEEITGEKLQTILLSIVNTLGDSAINDLITALNAEVAARQNADGSLEGAINQEGILRSNADSTLQGNINAEATARENADTALSNRLGSTITAENTAAEQIGAEAEARAAADTALRGLIDGITDNIENGYVYAGIATPSSTPATGKVFYLALTAGTYTHFGNTVVTQGINILKYNGSAWSLDAFIGIDDELTPISNNLPKSGNVLENIIKNGSAFDLSAYNAVDGVLATYADLDAALTALNVLPAVYKQGGMSVKFVQSSDNKYVQFRCMAQNFTTDTTKWQGVDDEPIEDSQNLIKSGAVFQIQKEIDEIVGKPAEEKVVTPTKINGYLLSTYLIWQSEVSGACALYKVLQGWKVKIIANAERNTYYGFVKDNTISAGAQAQSANGYGTLVTLSTGTTSAWLDINQDCYLYLSYNAPSGNDNSPSEVKIYYPAIVGDIEEINETLTEHSEHLEDIDETLEEYEPIIEGVSPVKGIYFGSGTNDLIAKNAIEAAWIEILDESFSLNKQCYLKLLYQASGIVQAFSLNDTYDGHLVLSYVAGGSVNNKREVILDGKNSYKDKVKLHLIIDFSLITGDINLPNTYIKLDELNTKHIIQRNISERVILLENEFLGKKILCLGDSITEISQNRKSYSDFLAEITGAAVINGGFGGSMLCQRTTPAVTPTSSTQAYAALDIINVVDTLCQIDKTADEWTRLYNAVEWVKTHDYDDNSAIYNRLYNLDMESVDVVTILGGTNDWWYFGQGFTQPNSDNINRSEGALNQIINKLLTAFPNIKIYWFSPIVRWNPSNSGQRTDANWCDTLTNGSCTLAEFSERLMAQVKKRHIPICDLYWGLGWNQQNFSNYFNDNDGTHPYKGLAEIGRKIAGFLVSNRTF